MTVKDLWGANFPYFGMQVIILYLFGSENCINSLRLLVALVTKKLCLKKKTFKIHKWIHQYQHFCNFSVFKKKKLKISDLIVSPFCMFLWMVLFHLKFSNWSEITCPSFQTTWSFCLPMYFLDSSEVKYLEALSSCSIFNPFNIRPNTLDLHFFLIASSSFCLLVIFSVVLFTISMFCSLFFIHVPFPRAGSFHLIFIHLQPLIFALMHWPCIFFLHLYCAIVYT